jgi:hypothetical protein
MYRAITCTCTIQCTIIWNSALYTLNLCNERHIRWKRYASACMCIVFYPVRVCAKYRLRSMRSGADSVRVFLQVFVSTTRCSLPRPVGKLYDVMYPRMVVFIAWCFCRCWRLARISGGMRRPKVSLEYAKAHDAAARCRCRMKLVIHPTNLGRSTRLKQE